MNRTVLVVDDERTLARNIQTYLTRHGYQVRCAHDGAGAVAALADFAPAVILLDLRLPDSDGIELLGSLRRQAPTARCIIVTGYSSLPTAVLAIKARADDYLAKPVVLSELRQRIARLMALERQAGYTAWWCW